MDKHEEQFQPESVEEQIKQYTQSTLQYVGSETPDERMIQDLQYVYTNYTQSGNRVRARLAGHLAQQNIAQQNNLHGINDTSVIQIERSRSPLVLPVKESSDLYSQKTTPPRKSKKIVTLITSFLVAAALVASVFMVIGSIHQPDKTTVAANHTTATATPVVTSTTSTQQTIPAKDCIQFQDNAVWNNLCKTNKVIAINRSLKLANGTTVTVRGAYADYNQIIYWVETDQSLLAGTRNDIDIYFTQEQMTTKQGINLKQSGMGIHYIDSDKHTDWIEGFYTNTLPADLDTLDLTLKTTISMSQPKKTYTGQIAFSVPMNSAYTIKPQQTVTTDGVAITLDSVTIGATGTQLAFSAPELPYDVYRTAFSCAFQNGQQHFTGCDYSIVNQNGKTSPIIGFGFMLQSDLTQHHGDWILTVTSENTGLSWVYHFKS